MAEQMELDESINKSTITNSNSIQSDISSVENSSAEKSTLETKKIPNVVDFTYPQMIVFALKEIQLASSSIIAEFIEKKFQEKILAQSNWKSTVFSTLVDKFQPYWIHDSETKKWKLKNVEIRLDEIIPWKIPEPQIQSPNNKNDNNDDDNVESETKSMASFLPKIPRSLELHAEDDFDSEDFDENRFEEEMAQEEEEAFEQLHKLQQQNQQKQKQPIAKKPKEKKVKTIKQKTPANQNNKSPKKQSIEQELLILQQQKQQQEDEEEETDREDQNNENGEQGKQIGDEISDDESEDEHQHPGDEEDYDQATGKRKRKTKTVKALKKRKPYLIDSDDGVKVGTVSLPPVQRLTRTPNGGIHFITKENMQANCVIFRTVLLQMGGIGTIKQVISKIQQQFSIFAACTKKLIYTIAGVFQGFPQIFRKVPFTKPQEFAISTDKMMPSWWKSQQEQTYSIENESELTEQAKQIISQRMIVIDALSAAAKQQPKPKPKKPKNEFRIMQNLPNPENKLLPKSASSNTTSTSAEKKVARDTPLIVQKLIIRLPNENNNIEHEKEKDNSTTTTTTTTFMTKENE